MTNGLSKGAVTFSSEVYANFPNSGTTTANFYDADNDTLPTGDWEIRAWVRPNSWTPTNDDNTIMGAWGTVGGTRTFRFIIHTEGTLRLVTSADGTGNYSTAALSTDSLNNYLTDGDAAWVRAVLTEDRGDGSGTLDYYYSTDGVTWTQLGATVVIAGGISTYNTTGGNHLAVGRRGEPSPDDPFYGDINRVTVYQGHVGSGGTPIIEFYPDRDATSLTGSWTSPYGETWNPQGSVTLVGMLGSTSWMGTQDISFENPGWTGNAYDILATATFSHAVEPDVTTEMFYNGGDQWVARFRATAAGTWGYNTSSAQANLNGNSGTIEVENAPASVLGPIEANGEVLVRKRNNGVETLALQPFAYDEDGLFDHIGLLSTDAGTRAGQIQSIFDIVENAGFGGVMTYVYNNFFSFGNPTYATHSSDNPDQLTFQIMEELLAEAKSRGMYLHVWFWGDEQDQETPIGLTGGINGVADQRMQRYFAARLGPIPGMIANYGYDLGEWTTEPQVRAWETYIDSHSGWETLLMARETIYDPGGDFLMGADKLDIYSVDDRPAVNGQDFYDRAIFRLTEFGGFPVMFERRFQHNRDGQWDAATTRRSMWKFSVAGVGAIYGNNTATPYPTADQNRFKVHRTFWSTRHIFPRVQVSGAFSEVAMRSTDATKYVVYQENVGTVSLPLAGMSGSQTAVAVDTVSQTYTEISLGTLSPGNQTWTAPSTSDWVVAVGV